MELNDYFKAFRNHWLVIALATFLALNAAALISWTMPKVYEANAMIFITADSATSSSYENSQFSMQRVKSYPDLVYSPEVLQPVLENPELDTSAAEIRSNVSATNPTETVYVQVTARADEAEESALLANLVAQSLTEHIRQVESGDGERSTAVDPLVAVPAAPPTWAESPNVVVNLALGGLLGLSIGMIIAIRLARRGGKLATVEDVRRAAGLDLIGQIGPDSSSSRAGSPDHNALAYRELWTNILLGTDGQMPKTILITSACESSAVDSRVLRRDGARFLADTGRRVCVLEANVDLSSAFEDEGCSLGFTDILAERASLPDASYVVEGSSLTIVPSGDWDERLVDYEDTRRVGTVVKELAENFDLLITHAGYEARPVSTSMIAPVADGVLILVSYGVTTASQLCRTALELKAIGVMPLGVVMLGVPERRRSNLAQPIGQRTRQQV